MVTIQAHVACDVNGCHRNDNVTLILNQGEITVKTNGSLGYEDEHIALAQFEYRHDGGGPSNEPPWEIPFNGERTLCPKHKAEQDKAAKMARPIHSNEDVPAEPHRKGEKDSLV